MKNMFESPEVFEAYARIDANFYLLRTLRIEEAKKSDNRTTIQKMVDDATGAWEVHVLSITKMSLDILREIRKDKQFIEAETAEEDKAIHGLEELKTRLENQRTRKAIAPGGVKK